MNELELMAPVKSGDNGDDVKRVQEWLTLNGFGVEIDRDFGPATEAAVKQFQARVNATQDGIVTPDLFTQLTQPMRNALAAIAPGQMTLGQLTVAYAQQHLAQRPLEVGGDNCGPWVRLYMDGHDGEEWKWCAGFACFCLNQAAQGLGVALPITPSFSCDSLAASAAQNNLRHACEEQGLAAAITPGSFFLVRRSPGDWMHTGLVISAADKTISTIEGNTNDDGSSNGYEVTSRTRSFDGKDFIFIA